MKKSLKLMSSYLYILSSIVTKRSVYVYSKQKILLFSLFSMCIMCLTNATVHASMYSEEYTIRIFINHVLVDTLRCRDGELLSLTNNYNGLPVREWAYSIKCKNDDGVIISKRVSVIDENVDITITGNDDIYGYSWIMGLDAPVNDNGNAENINDITEASNASETNLGTSKDNNQNTSVNSDKAIKKLLSPCILKYERGSKKLVVKGEKETYVYIKRKKKIVTIYMNKKTKKTITLSKKLKRGEKIKIYAKKSGYKKSKVQTYKVK